MAGTAIHFVVGSAVTRADIPVLCADLADLLRGRAGVVVICDVAGVARPDVVTVEALARLRVTARRHGRRLVVSGAAPGLRRLVALLGLTEALSEPGRQPEQWEQAGGVEEVVDRGDPPGADLQHDQCPRFVP
jgi:anti-anti-sigma regulatory factor